MKQKTIQSIFTCVVSVVISLFFVSCNNSDTSDDPSNLVANNDAKVYFVYTLDTSNGSLMTRASKTNSEVFDEFYQKIITGELVAPNFELTLTEVNSNAVYHFKGKWSSHDMLTLRTGTYHVVGKSTAEGSNTQDKCSFTFDEKIDITVTSNVITLHAKYDCSLLIFNNKEIQSLENYNGSSTTSFFTFNTYRYAFINDILYDTTYKNAAYIQGKYTDDAEFKIFTGNLDFEKGKYYIYNSISGGFEVPSMEEGNYSQVIGSDVKTLLIDTSSQPITVGGYINNYSNFAIKKKGLIVSKSTDDMYVYKNTEMEKPTNLTNSNHRDYNFPKNLRFIDCTDINEEEYICELLYLEGNADYYVKAFIITNNDEVMYGNAEKIHTQDYNRYKGKADYANVWHAFDYTLFDLMTEEIINPSGGFYYSTNENPTTVRHQYGTSYNTCYKFISEWNYKLWYYNHDGFCDAEKIVSIPKMKMVNGKLEINKAENDASKSITIYYSVGEDGKRPENFSQIYTTPITVYAGDIIHCYAISSNGYMSYTNTYKVY